VLSQCSCTVNITKLHKPVLLWLQIITGKYAQHENHDWWNGRDTKKVMFYENILKMFIIIYRIEL